MAATGDTSPVVPAPFTTRSDLPAARPWSARSRSCGVLPGEVADACWNALDILGEIADWEPTDAALLPKVERQFGITTAFAAAAVDALRNAGLAERRGPTWRPTEAGRTWLAREDPAFVVAQLHRRVRYVGELLARTTRPCTPSELLADANERYGMGWSTEAQVASRRRWLESAGMLAVTTDGRLATTDAGHQLLPHLAIEPPTEAATALRPAPTGPARGLGDAVAARLADLLAPVDTDTFGRAVVGAFELLGFDVRRVGVPGQEALVLQADLGLDRSYRVLLDTGATGALGADDVDWAALAGACRTHATELAVAVRPGAMAPEPPADAVPGCSSLAAERLAAALRQHAVAPLGLEEYRALVGAGPAAAEEPHPVAVPAEAWVRTRDLARALVDVVRERSERLGALTAREAMIAVSGERWEPAVDVREVRAVLDTLSAPLLGVLRADGAGGYLPACGPTVTAQRLELLVGDLGRRLPADELPATATTIDLTGVGPAAATAAADAGPAGAAPVDDVVTVQGWPPWPRVEPAPGTGQPRVDGAA